RALPDRHLLHSLLSLCFGRQRLPRGILTHRACRICGLYGASCTAIWSLSVNSFERCCFDLQLSMQPSCRETLALLRLEGPDQRVSGWIPAPPSLEALCPSNLCNPGARR